MARDFDGNNDEINVTLSSGATIVSFAHWIYPDAVAQYANTLRISDGSNVQGSLEFDDGWGYVFVWHFSGGNAAWSVPKPTTGSWQHYVATYDSTDNGNDPMIYKNGSLLSEFERIGPSGSPDAPGTAVEFGGNNDSHWYNGRLAEVAMWNREISASEVAILADGYSPLFVSRGLIGYWPLIGKFSPEIDVINGQNGTLQSAPTAIAHPRIIYPTPEQILAISQAAVTSLGKQIRADFLI